MMHSNSKNNPQDSEKTLLTREEINSFRKNPSELDLTHGDEFDLDALEGWSKASADTKLMQNLDRKFLPKSRYWFWMASILFLMITATTIFTMNQKNEPNVKTKNNILLYKQDVVISKKIKELKELPQHLQIKPEIVLSNFKSKQEKLAENKNAIQAENNEEFIKLPLKKVQLNSTNPKYNLEKKHGKEIYLNDFKLLDYRFYRARPDIHSEQIILSGTPADNGLENVEIDKNNWKAIDIPYHDYIEQTVEQFKNGNYKQTLNRTQHILNFYPDDINALFYGGLCLYNLNEMDQAIESFLKVTSNPFDNFDEEAQWYIANAYELKNEKSKAREWFLLIVNQKGFYAKQAEKMLKK